MMMTTMRIMMMIRRRRRRRGIKGIQMSNNDGQQNVGLQHHISMVDKSISS